MIYMRWSWQEEYEVVLLYTESSRIHSLRRHSTARMCDTAYVIYIIMPDQMNTSMLQVERTPGSVITQLMALCSFRWVLGLQSLSDDLLKCFPVHLV